MATKVDFLRSTKREVNQAHIVSLTDDSDGTASDTLADSNGAVTGVDGTGSNAASKADVDARLVTLTNSIASLAAKVEALTVALENAGITATS